MISPELQLAVLAEKQEAQVGFYYSYVQQLEQEHDELLNEISKLKKEKQGLKSQITFLKGRCAELEKIPTNKDFENSERERLRYREMAQELKKERDKLQARLSGKGKS